MIHESKEVELAAPVELRPRDLQDVAGGSPTLPLPPPAARLSPEPWPW